MSVSVRRFAAAFATLACACLSTSFACADDEIFAVQSRASTPNFQLFLNLADDSTVTGTGPLFGPAGGVYGASFLDGALYAVELENGTFVDYLATIPHEGALIGQGSRVGAAPIGFDNVESLATVGDQLFATSLDFSAHRTTLITIDEVSGVGTGVGTGDFDVMLVGLAHDPVGNVLYGAGIPFGATGVDTPNLYTLDPGTGATTLVGDMGAVIQSLAWDADLGLIGAFDRLYDINAATGAATPIGATDFTDGIPGAFNGLYSLAALVSDISLDADFDDDGDVDAADLVQWNDDFGVNGDSDADADGDSDGADFVVWQRSFGSTAFSPVPEPSTFALIALLAIARPLFTRCNRRA